VHDINDVGACISSGSFKHCRHGHRALFDQDALGLANSFNTNLLIRAADVCLKERARLVLMLRETPLHLGHLRLMSQVTEAGAVLVPPLPAFYHRPKTLEDIIDQSVNKALDQFDLGVDSTSSSAGPATKSAKKPSRPVNAGAGDPGRLPAAAAWAKAPASPRWTGSRTSFTTSWALAPTPAPSTCCLPAATGMRREARCRLPRHCHRAPARLLRGEVLHRRDRRPHRGRGRLPEVADYPATSWKSLPPSPCARNCG
jgi:hypothetical protein